jgi:hypothetical protein
MLRNLFRSFASTAPRLRPGAHHRRLSCIEDLEPRLLLVGSPTIYTVDVLSDTGTGTGATGDLRYCIDEANVNPNTAGSIIEFAPLLFNVPRTITASLELSNTAGPIAIVGPGASLLTLSGGGYVQVLDVTRGVTATISGLTISDGLATFETLEDVDEAGGGLENDGGTVALSDAVVSGDRADPEYPLFHDGIAAEGGGIGQMSGTLTLNDDTVNGNTASGSSGSVGSHDHDGQAGGGGLGGGLYVGGGQVTIINSTIAGNKAVGAEGGPGGPGSISGVFGTRVGTNGGAGGAGSGGGVYVAHGSVTIVNTTIAGNVITGGAGGAGGDGGVFAGFGGPGGGATGGGLDQAGGTVVLDNSVVALNNAGPSNPSDVVGPVTGSFNLIGIGGSGSLNAAGDGNLLGAGDPGLGTLASNGGSTPTMALLPGSPAIDAGSAALAVDPSTGKPLTTDQRGPGFVRLNGGTVDIGAFEHQPPPSTGGGESQPAQVASISVGWGIQTDALETAADGLRLLPASRNTDLPWLGIDKLMITLNEPQMLTAGEVSVFGITGVNYGPVSVSGSGTSYAISFARPIEKADRVTVTIAGAGIATYTRRLDILPGDFFDTGVVTGKDITAIHNESTGKHGDMPTIFGEITGDGTVNASDFKSARRFQGARLPKLPKTGGKRPKVVLARLSPFAFKS